MSDEFNRPDEQASADQPAPPEKPAREPTPPEQVPESAGERNQKAGEDEPVLEAPPVPGADSAGDMQTVLAAAEFAPTTEEQPELPPAQPIAGEPERVEPDAEVGELARDYLQSVTEATSEEEQVEVPPEAPTQILTPEDLARESAGEDLDVPDQMEMPAEEAAVAAQEAGEPKPEARKKTRKRSKTAAPSETVEAEPEKPAAPKSEKMDWYILKVQSNREDSIREALLRRIAIAGYDPFFGDIIVPTEKVTEVKGGKKRVTKRKLYPGYLIIHMEFNEDTWFLVRETPGVGDFTGAAGRPTPMLPHEVARIVARQEEKSEKAPKLNIRFRPGDQVKINEGTFENFEGQVESIDETNGRVTVMINIFGRSTPVELEYWQIGNV